MFGNRRLTDLEQRLADLEEQQRTGLAQISADVQRRLDELERAVAENPERRLALALSSIEEELALQLRQAVDGVASLRRAADELAELRRVARGDAVTAERFVGELDRVYQAEWTGFVCVYFDGGSTDIISLLVGVASPPTECVGRMNVRNHFNSYVGAVVRRGEYWMARSHREEGEEVASYPRRINCVFTPFA